MKWMMTLTMASVIGIGFTGNSIYSEVKIFTEQKESIEISSSMYRALLWHAEVYNNNGFEQVALKFFNDDKIDTREFAKLKQLAKSTSGPIIYLPETDEQLWHARLTFKKYLEAKHPVRLAANN